VQRISSDLENLINESFAPAGRRLTPPEAMAELSQAPVMNDPGEPSGTSAATGMAGIRGKIAKYDLLSKYHLLRGCEVTSGFDLAGSYCRLWCAEKSF